jgi:anaerobic magnesium-protoporphyrin IX monomethyl ester cyclase
MITLINPPGLKNFSGIQPAMTANPPLGLAYIAAALKEAGLGYHIIDGAGDALDTVRPYKGPEGDTEIQLDNLKIQGLFPEEITGRIPPETDIVGISCMFSVSWPLVRDIADHVRARFPKALLVLGSEHGTAFPDHSLRSSAFDVIVLGEGEETFVSLVQARVAGRPFDDLPGVAFKKDGGVVNNGLGARIRDVNEIAPPDWDSFPIEDYIDRHQTNGVYLGRSMQILATRGCPYRCAFCSSPNMWTTRFIPRDPKQVVDEMELYIQKYNVANFDFQDLTAIVNRRWAVAFCQEIIERGLDITWQMPSGTRSEVFDEEVADLLYRSGCRVLAFAPESGSPEILKAIKKKADTESLIQASRTVLKRGLKLTCFLVIGFPTDRPDTIRQTMRLVRRLAVIGVDDVVVSKFVPYPGSALFKQLLDDGKIEPKDSFFLADINYYTTKAPSYCDAVSPKQLYRTMIWMFLNFYFISFALRPWRVVATLWSLATKGVEETRYAKWLVDRFFTRRRWRRLEKQRGV